MSMFVRTSSAWPVQPHPRSAWALSFRQIAASVLSWPSRVHANRKLLNQMAGMSSHELADIGLTPADLQDTAALPLSTEIGLFLEGRATSRRRGRSRSGR